MSIRSFSEAPVFHEGQEIDVRNSAEDPEHQQRSLEMFRNFVSEVQEGKRQPYVFFDVDGTLIPSADYETGASIPMETAKNQQTIEEYVASHQEEIDQLKFRIEHLAKFGFKFGINTGRGIGFTRRLVEQIFPYGSVKAIIGESGAAILEADDNGQWKSELTKPDSVDATSYETMARYKDQIEAIAKAEGGFVETGKEVIVSVNPPEGKNTEEFENILKEKFAAAGIALEDLNIVHSSSAVDIGPKGAKKIESLKQLLGEDIAIYFGDASNDEEAMKGSDVNVVVGNAQSSTIETAKKAVPPDWADPSLKPGFGVVVDKEHKDISGAIEGLKNIELYWRYEKKRRQQEAPTELTE